MVAKKKNAWMEFLHKYHKENPSIPYSQAMKEAAKVYKKLCKGGADPNTVSASDGIDLDEVNKKPVPPAEPPTETTGKGRRKSRRRKGRKSRSRSSRK